MYQNYPLALIDNTEELCRNIRTRDYKRMMLEIESLSPEISHIFSVSMF